MFLDYGQLPTNSWFLGFPLGGVVKSMSPFHVSQDLYLYGIVVVTVFSCLSNALLIASPWFTLGEQLVLF